MLESKGRGDLLLVGTFADPRRDGSMAVFTSHEGAERFVAGDPFVAEGVVGSCTRVASEWMESSADL